MSNTENFDKYHRTAADYDRILGEGQSACDYVDKDGNDLYDQPRGTLSEAEHRKQTGMRRFQTGERDADFGYHSVADYNKILGEGQDDYGEGEYMELHKKFQEKKRQQGQKVGQQQQQQQGKQRQEYPPTHLHGKQEPDDYVSMDKQSYQNETMESERDNLENTAMIPGCGESSKMEKPHHYVSNQFQPETMLQARKMDESNIPEGSMNTTCPGFEGAGHHTPIPGAGQMSHGADSRTQHDRSFHLVGSDRNKNANMGTPEGKESIPRTIINQPQDKTDESQHPTIFRRLKKTVSR